MWCIGTLDETYRKRMYHLLELYAQPYNPLEPVVCIDEKSKQLIAHTRTPLPPSPGKDAKVDYEYKRNGTRNLFFCVEPLAGKRVVEVTEQRKKADFVAFIKTLLTHHYPDVRRLHIVLDNLNTHFEKSFTDTLSEEEAQAILSKVTFHYTPTHASWLNMAEIEIGIFDRQGIKGRIPTEKKLTDRINALAERRNAQKAKIHWTFTKEKADLKLGKHYV